MKNFALQLLIKMTKIQKTNTKENSILHKKEWSKSVEHILSYRVDVEVCFFHFNGPIKRV